MSESETILELLVGPGRGFNLLHLFFASGRCQIPHSVQFLYLLLLYIVSLFILIDFIYSNPFVYSVNYGNGSIQVSKKKRKEEKDENNFGVITDNRKQLWRDNGRSRSENRRRVL